MLIKPFKNMKTYISVIIFLSMFQAAVAQECQFYKASPDDKVVPTKFPFELKGKKLLINNDGTGEVKYSNGIVKEIKISLPKLFFIENLQFSDCLGDIIVVCELSDGDNGCGRVFRLDKDRLIVKWYAEIPAFNVGEPLLQNKHLYLTSLDWVGKLAVKTGNYDWQIGGLYTRPSGWYNSFLKPVIKNGKVYFTERGYADKMPYRTLIVGDKTGKILGGAPPKNEK